MPSTPSSPGSPGPLPRVSQSAASPYDGDCTSLIAAATLNPLGPGQPTLTQRPSLASLTPQRFAAGRPVADPDHLRCCLSGLWLLHNFLDESHSLSQEIHTASGSYWHGIMHRREPDFGNSKYWFRQVEDHPVYAQVAGEARRIANAVGDSLPTPARYLRDADEWDPFQFVNLCSTAYGRGGALEQLCREVAWAEWHVLFEYCQRQAFGMT